MAVKTTIGHPARGDEYFGRPALTGKLWEKVRAGANILIAAPRRVGKSSILFHFFDNPPKNFRLIYIDTESVNNENEFFKRLFNHVVNTLTKARKYSKIVTNFTIDLAVACNLETGFENVLNSLKYDGYINNNDDPKVYRYNSPLLKIWWNKNVAF